MVFNVFFVCFSIYLIIQGIYLLATGKFFSSKENDKRKLYEKKAYDKYLKLSGVMYILAGVFAGANVAFKVLLPDVKYVSYVMLGFVIVALIVMIVASKKLMKKKSTNVLNGNVDDDQYIDED